MMVNEEANCFEDYMQQCPVVKLPPIQDKILTDPNNKIEQSYYDKGAIFGERMIHVPDT